MTKITLEEAAELTRLRAKVKAADKLEELLFRHHVGHYVHRADVHAARIADLERQLAEARDKALEEAAVALLECSVWCDSQERTDASWHNGVIDARKHHMARIRNLKGTP